jgi:MoaA/NifB/PqqE/SkfB family radical SAM enzyme
MSDIPETLSQISIENLRAPLFIAWHMTNRCNLNCIHCLWDSGEPWPNELNVDEALELCKQIVGLEVPYVALSGGEPLLYPGFWQVCEFLKDHNVSVKIETNGLLINKETARKLAKLELRSVQVSLDGASQQSYSMMRPRADFKRVLDAIKHLNDEGVITEIVFVPAKFNIHEVEQLIDLAVELGVTSFYTGKTMYIGRAVKYWDTLNPTNEQYKRLVETLDRKGKEYENQMLVYYYPYDVIDELKYRLEHPAASPLVLSTGKVKLIGSLPFVCGDVRLHSLAEIWERYKKAWRHPAVIEHARRVFENPSLLSQALEPIELKF